MVEENGILRWPAVKKMTGLSRPTIWRMTRKGKFPARIQLGESSVGWRADEILAWIESRPRVGGKAVAK